MTFDFKNKDLLETLNELEKEEQGEPRTKKQCNILKKLFWPANDNIAINKKNIFLKIIIFLILLGILIYIGLFHLNSYADKNSFFLIFFLLATTSIYKIFYYLLALIPSINFLKEKKEEFINKHHKIYAFTKPIIFLINLIISFLFYLFIVYAFFVFVEHFDQVFFSYCILAIIAVPSVSVGTIIILAIITLMDSILLNKKYLHQKTKTFIVVSVLFYFLIIPFFIYMWNKMACGVC